ncbi:MAG: Gfo/Idh/MocA family oxidoreductase [Candidatus Limivivens sp.]|nr:Gfo/Idh/MocA family oxidoreductase [Candidatus Limivivens sp.]
MDGFRFAVMGAGKIAGKFCEAVKLLDQKAEASGEHCEICAVASKSLERARAFAERNQIAKFYDSYEKMLEKEKPDCVYIAVTPNDHFRLTMLCVEHGIPVLCEKAMFQDSAEAEQAFGAAQEKQVFVMEALWSRYLPAVRQAKTWLAQGRIGRPEIAQFSIGFAAPEDPENRYLNSGLGGGAAKDITVYAYEITTFLLEQKIRKMDVSVTWGETGVDLVDHISMEFEHMQADLMASFVTKMEDRMVIYGRKGKIILPAPHYASECLLYDETGALAEHFTDTVTENGFVYEAADVIRCIRAGKLQSETVPWEDTRACARLFDRIAQTRESLGS